MSAEVTEVHTRLLKTTLLVEESRVYWQRAGSVRDDQAIKTAFESSWFGAKSLPRVEVIIRNMRVRYLAYPEALNALRRWRHMDPESRTLVCHWHLQLADPLYRAFSGDYLPGLRQAGATARRDGVVAWLSKVAPARWSTTTKVQFASKLLSCAFATKLLLKKVDPRPLSLPHVPDVALAYLLYALRGIEHQGTLFQNPYLASVGLCQEALFDRLSGLSDPRYRKMGTLHQLDWSHAKVSAWAEAT